MGFPFLNLCDHHWSREFALFRVDPNDLQFDQFFHLSFHGANLGDHDRGGELALFLINPNYLNQLTRTRQSEASSSITQLQNAIVAFADENGVYPTSWKDLNEVAAIMTPSGITTQNDFKKMTLASSGCESKGQNNCYTVEAIHTNQDSLYTLSALPVNTNLKNYPTQYGYLAILE